MTERTANTTSEENRQPVASAVEDKQSEVCSDKADGGSGRAVGQRASSPVGEPSFQSKIIEPALIITLVSAALYWVGYSYLQAYYARFGVDVNSLELSTVSYISAAIEPLIGLVFVAFMSFDKWPSEDGTKWASFRGNLLIFCVGILFLIHARYYYDVSNVNFGFSLGFGMGADLLSRRQRAAISVS